MNMASDQIARNLTLKLDGPLDERGAEEMKQRFKQLKVSTNDEVTLDFKNVSYIGSAGIGKLLLFYKDMAMVSGKLKIVHVSDSVMDLLKIVKLDSVFEISKD